MESTDYKIKIIKKQGYDEIYRVGKDWSMLAEYKLHDEYKLYQVAATYAKTLKPSIYYVIAKNKRNARKKFLLRFSWLNIILIVLLVDNDAKQKILTDVRKIIF
jgi:hypothetical protein